MSGDRAQEILKEPSIKFQVITYIQNVEVRHVIYKAIQCT